MGLSVTVIDETTSGGTGNELTLEFLNERVTAREIIRSRVYQEVSEYNARPVEVFRGLVQPAEAERVLNGYRMRERQQIDWEAQYEKALEAFRGNGIILIVDDRQLEQPDDVVELRPASTVTFLRLRPL